MLGKIVLTLLIMLIGLAWIRQKRAQDKRDAALPAAASPSPAPGELNDFRVAAYLFLVMMLGTGGALYYSRWQDAHSLVTVILHREGSAEPVHYQVEKGQLDARAFTTVDGVRVTVASTERMEVIGLE